VKLAKKIAAATFGKEFESFTEHGQRYWVVQNDCIKKDKIESIIAAKLEPMKLAFMSIVKLDKTPQYEYGQAAPNGDLPPSGDRWVTPRERAEAALAMLEEE